MSLAPDDAQRSALLHAQAGRLMERVVPVSLGLGASILSNSAAHTHRAQLELQAGMKGRCMGFAC